MKKLLFLLLLVSAHSQSNAQSWAPIGAKWTFEARDNVSPDRSFQEWTVTKDTLVKDKMCRFIKKTGYWTTSMRDLITYEDSGKVYNYHYELDTFHLLYDFNKNAGESWLLMKDTCRELTVWVDSTAIETINNVPLKVQYVRFTRDTVHFRKEKIIQNIGHTKSNFHYDYHCMGGIADGPYVHSLRCYQDSAIGFYSTGIAPNCDYVGLEEEQKRAEITLFPNPAQDKIYLQTHSQSILSYNIYNSLGQVVLKGKTNTGLTAIQVNALQNGFYIFELVAGKYTQKQCFIIRK